MLSECQKKNRLKLIDRAYYDNCMHIPSALSMLDYFYFLDRKIDYNKDALVIGKPYGQLAYHTVWNSDNNLLVIGKTQKVTWADTTIGNCLGVAAGLAMSGNYNNIFINIGDGSLQEGTILEASQFIGSCKIFLSKIILCIDCNNMQCVGNTYQTTDDVQNLFSTFKWNVVVVDGHNDRECEQLSVESDRPLCIVFDTVKGYGIKCMEENPVEWHYKRMTTSDYEQIKKELILS